MGWFPRYSIHGDVISEGPQRWQAGWFTDAQPGWTNGATLVINGVDTGILGHNLVAWGGCKWAWSNGLTIRTSWGQEIHNASDPILSAGGDFGYVENPQSTNKRLIVNGNEIARGAITEPRLSRTAVGWKQDGSAHICRFDTGEIFSIPEAGWPVPIDTPEGPWLSTMRGGGAWLCPFGSGLGIPIGVGSGEVRNPDAVSIGDEIHVVFTSNAGAEVEHTVRRDLPLMPWPSAPEPVPVPSGGDDMRALPRKLWVFPFFSHSEAYPPDVPPEEHVGNAILVVSREGQPDMMARDLARVAALAQPMIVEAKPDEFGGALNPDLTVSWWTAGADEGTLADRVELAAALDPQVPIIAYLDRGAHTDWPVNRPGWMTDKTWPTVQAYPNPGESPDAFRTRVSRMLERVTTYRNSVGLVAAFFDRNGAVPIADIEACIPVYEQFVRDFQVMAFGMFADRRPGGITQYPQLRPKAMAFLRALTARPNRYDGWNSADVDNDLRNKLGQTVELIQFSQAEKDRVLALLSGAPEPEPEPGDYIPSAPDLAALHAQMAAAHPQAWADAYEYPGHPRTDEFVRLFAKAAHQQDARFGLNGKRGTDELSLDVLAFKNPTVPAICGSVELRDFIFDDGAPGQPNEKHEYQWSDATILPGQLPHLPNGVPGKWIQP